MLKHSGTRWAAVWNNRQFIYGVGNSRNPVEYPMQCLPPVFSTKREAERYATDRYNLLKDHLPASFKPRAIKVKVLIEKI